MLTSSASLAALPRRRLHRQQSDGADAEDRDALVRLHAAASHRLHGYGSGLHQGSLLAADVVGETYQLRGRPYQVFGQSAVDGEPDGAHRRALDLGPVRTPPALAAGEHPVYHHPVSYCYVGDGLTDPVDRPGDLVTCDHGHLLAREGVRRVSGDKHGTVEVLFDVGGADSAIVDAQPDLVGLRDRVWHRLQS